MSFTRFSPYIFKPRNLTVQALDGAKAARTTAATSDTQGEVLTGAQAAAGNEAQYRLQVTIETRRADIRRFERAAQQARALFDNAKLRLIMSGWDVKVNPGTRADSAEIFNIWELGNDADNLLKAMKYLGDSAEYFRFEKLTFNEHKTLVLPLIRERGFKPDGVQDRSAGSGEDGAQVETARASQAKSGRQPRARRAPAARPGGASRYLYLKTTGEVRTPNIAEYRARLESGLVRFRQRTGWQLGDAYLGLTGKPNTITQLWLVTDDKLATINSRLASAPWDDLLDKEPEWQLLQPAAFDPIVQGGLRKDVDE